MKRFLVSLAAFFAAWSLQEYRDRRAKKRAERQKQAELMTVVRRAHQSGEGDMAQRYREAQR